MEMLAWLARDGWLDMKVAVMRRGDGILRAKFGLFVDAAGAALISMTAATRAEARCAAMTKY